ncbi:MAG TPA: aminotransferase class III-fold pyridoxal phosphate-dependent enzyme, partial [Ignisphaera sp.]|nr:aminotransferase class III-fold pyridoxal phosphate-dependent enzyme [Ignisphaera sp.]
AKALKEIAPIKSDVKFFFGNSGAEAIEGAIKICRGHFKNSRPYIIAFYGSFHGRTMAAMTLTASKSIQHRWFAPLLPGVIHVPYPYPYRCPFNTDDPIECGEQALAFIEDYVLSKYVAGDEVAAIFFEPIQGEGGYIVPPDNFLPGLRKLADKYGILLVDDEVQAGMGRSGKWWAIQHWNVEPDIVTSAKALASGIPISAIIGRSEIMDLPRGSHASTFGGNPIACRVGVEVINIIKEEKLLENATRVGEYIMKKFNELKDELEIIGDVRGKGLMIGVELVRNKDTKEPARKELAKILEKAFKSGILVIGAGLSALRFSPPLNIPIELVEKALDILERIIRDVNKELRK